AASLGLLCSVVAPTRTWANFAFALVLFLLSMPMLFFHFFLRENSLDLLTNVVKVGLNPVGGWWFWTNQWESGHRPQEVQIMGSILGTVLFASAAYALWCAARWRFRPG